MTMSKMDTRLEHRTTTSKLGIAVQCTWLLFFKQFYHSQLIDICHGGVSFSNNTLKLKIGKTVSLFFYFENKTYHVKGLVVRQCEKQGKSIYGIMFIDIPAEMDSLIDSIMRTDKECHNQTITNSTNNHRKAGDRVPVHDSQIFVKRMQHPDDIQDGLQSSKMIEASVVNISKGGIAFVCDKPLSKSTPFYVQFRISNLDDSMQVSGLVHYAEKRTDHYFYGVEFKMVPMEFVRLLDDLL